MTQLHMSCKFSVLHPKVRGMKRTKVKMMLKHKLRLSNKLNKKQCGNNRSKRKPAKRRRRKLSASVNKKRNNAFS